MHSSSNRFRIAALSLAALQLTVAGPLAALAASDAGSRHTDSPIKHVIVIVGENRTFDHLFATYEPVKGESIDNLLSKHIVNADGTPGKSYSAAWQYQADVRDTGSYEISPKDKVLYPLLPAPLNGGPANVCKDNGICTLADAVESESGLEDSYYRYLLTGGTGLTGPVPDSRISGVHATAPYSTLPPGPFQLTKSPSFSL
jgi:phospholipase C